jgi:hypothetical protein
VDPGRALQETLLSAWQGLGGFEERASVRTWLYRGRDELLPEGAALTTAEPEHEPASAMA